MKGHTSSSQPAINTPLIQRIDIVTNDGIVPSETTRASLDEWMSRYRRMDGCFHGRIFIPASRQHPSMKTTIHTKVSAHIH